MASQQAQEIWIPAVQPPYAGLASALRRRWRLVALSLIAALAVGAAMAVRTDPQYSANARIRFLGDHSLFASGESHSAAEEAASVRAQFYILRSPRILGIVADRLNLPQRWNTDQRGASQRLEQLVQPRRLMDANMTEVRVVAPDPELAAEVANSVVDVYIQHANQPRMEQAQLTLNRLHLECQQQEQELAKADEQVDLLRKEMGLDAGQGQISATSLNPLRQMLVQDEASLIDSQIRVESTVQSSADVLLALESANDNVSRQLATKWVESEDSLAAMEQRYGHDHPLVQARRTEFEQINTAGVTQVQRIIQMAQADKVAAEARANHARQRLAEAEQTLASAGGSYGQLMVAEQRQDVIKNLLKVLNERAQKMEVDMNIAGPAAEVIEAASAPSVPELGTPIQMILMAAGIGLMGGVLLAMGVDRLDNTIREPEEVEWQLDLPLLGIVAGSRSSQHARPDKQTLESYRMIRNSIDFADHTMRSLCLSGAGSNEGTSATAVNLACAWAEHGARVMLVDVSLHEPRLHKLLGVGNDQGLIDHIISSRALEELLISTSVPNLSILTAGAPASPGSGPPTLTPQHLGQLLIWARSNADIIILDTGPVLKSSDAALVARQADATVLVARQQHTSVRDLRRAAHMLSNCGEGLLGVVLTGVRAGASWDPMPVAEAAAAEEGQTAVHRSAVSRQRKRNRHAA